MNIGTYITFVYYKPQQLAEIILLSRYLYYYILHWYINK